MEYNYLPGNQLPADGTYYHVTAEAGTRYAIAISGSGAATTSVTVAWVDPADATGAAFPDMADAPNPLTTVGGMEILAPTAVLAVKNDGASAVTVTITAIR
jgi:hypothetical protein